MRDRNNNFWIYTAVIWTALFLAVAFSPLGRAEPPGPAALAYPGGLDCVTYDDKGNATAKFRVFWVQLRDVTMDSMTFQADGGNITLSRDYLWLCRQFKSDLEEKWFEDE